MKIDLFSNTNDQFFWKEINRSPIFIVSRASVVLDLNFAAKHLLSTDLRLTIKGGRLTTRRTSEASMLAARVAAASGTDDSPSHRFVALRDRSGHPTMILAVTPLGADSGASGEPANAVSVSACDLFTSASLDFDLLLHVFGLTVTEARFAIAFLGHRDVGLAARSVGVVPETGRSHLKRIMTKVGVRNQASLAIALVRAMNVGKLQHIVRRAGSLG